MKLRLRLFGTDYYRELPDWDSKRKPFQVLLFMELTEQHEILDERHFQFEITEKRIELRNT